MCEKLDTNFENMPDSPKFERPKGNEEIFSIMHYADRVTYTGTGFLEKNRDTMSLDMLAAFLCSEKLLVEEIFNDDLPEETAKKKAGKQKESKGTLRKRLDKVDKLFATVES